MGGVDPTVWGMASSIQASDYVSDENSLQVEDRPHSSWKVVHVEDGHRQTSTEGNLAADGVSTTTCMTACSDDTPAPTFLLPF